MTYNIYFIDSSVELSAKYDIILVSISDYKLKIITLE